MTELKEIAIEGKDAINFYMILHGSAFYLLSN